MALGAGRPKLPRALPAARDAKVTTPPAAAFPRVGLRKLHPTEVEPSPGHTGGHLSELDNDFGPDVPAGETFRERGVPADPN